MTAISINLWVWLLENLPSPQIVGEPVPSGQKRPGMNKILMVFGTFWGNLGYFGVFWGISYSPAGHASQVDMVVER